MMIDYTIGMGNILEILSIVIGGIWVLVSIKSDVGNVKVDVVLMQSEIKKLGDILVKIADMRGEIRVLDSRVAAAESDIREIRHGKGFIREAITREYP